MRPLLHKGKVLVTNWHLFAPESGHVEGGKSYTVVNKGPESPDRSRGASWAICMTMRRSS